MSDTLIISHPDQLSHAQKVTLRQAIAQEETIGFYFPCGKHIQVARYLLRHGLLSAGTFGNHYLVTGDGRKLAARIRP